MRTLQETVFGIRLVYSSRRAELGKAGHWVVRPDGRTYVGRRREPALAAWRRLHAVLGEVAMAGRGKEGA